MISKRGVENYIQVFELCPWSIYSDATVQDISYATFLPVSYYHVLASILLPRSCKFLITTFLPVSYYHVRSSFLLPRSCQYLITTFLQVSYYHVLASFLLPRSCRFLFTTCMPVSYSIRCSCIPLFYVLRNNYFIKNHVNSDLAFCLGSHCRCWYTLRSRTWRNTLAQDRNIRSYCTGPLCTRDTPGDNTGRYVVARDATAPNPDASTANRRAERLPAGLAQSRAEVGRLFCRLLVEWLKNRTHSTLKPYRNAYA